MINEVHIVYQQLILFIILLIIFLFSGNTIILFVCLGALGVALLLTIKIKNYNPKLYHLVSVPILVFLGLLLVYTYLFRLPQNPSYIFLFGAFVVIWIVITSFYIYYYSQKLYKQKII